jgi:hypothetical protein
LYAIEAMAARCRGYLAGLQSWVSPRTRQTLLGGEPFGSFEHSYDALGGVDNADLLAFEADLKSTRGWEFKYGSRNWSVVEADGVRALLNNEAPAAVQSSVRLDGGPPPLSGPLGSAVGGLGLAAPLYKSAGFGGWGKKPAALLLGGGGCALPPVLRDALGATVTTVEPDDEVRGIAREYFGAPAELTGNDAAEAAPAVPTPGSWGHLLGGCGAAAVAEARDGSFDIVVVDAADGGNAPPDALASPAFFADVGRVLAPRTAVLAVNVVARDAETLKRVRDAATGVGGELFECELPAPLVAEGSPDFARLLFAVRGDALPSLAGHPLLAHVDEGEVWVQGFRGLV